MLIIVEQNEEVSRFMKTYYNINLEEDFNDVQDLKNKVFTNLYYDAKKYLSSGTVNGYKKIINSCGNNSKKKIKNAVMSLGKAVFKKIKGV